MTDKTFEKLCNEFGINEGTRIYLYRLSIKNEIEEFKFIFQNTDIKRSPEANMMFKIFGHTDISKLNLKELTMLGFNSGNTWREDYDIF